MAVGGRRPVLGVVKGDVEGTTSLEDGVQADYAQFSEVELNGAKIDDGYSGDAAGGVGPDVVILAAHGDWIAERAFEGDEAGVHVPGVSFTLR